MEKTKSQLISENEELRDKVEELEISQRNSELLERALLEGEHHYRSLYQNAPLGYQSLDERGNIIEVNEAWCRSLGYEREEVIGMSFIGYLTDKYQNKFKLRFSELMSKGQMFSEEYEMIKKDGSRVTMSFEDKAAYTIDGEFKQSHSILYNMTAQRQMERALRESEEKYRNLIYYINDAIYETDEDLIIRFISPAIEYIFGYKSEDVTGKSLEDFIYTDDLELYKERFKIASSGIGGGFECRIKAKSGKLRWINLTYKPILLDERFVGMRGVISDITERKQAEEGIQKSERRLKNAQELAKVGDYEWELATNKINWSDGLYKIFGLPVGLPLNTKKLTKCIHPDDQEYNKKMMNKWLRDGGGEPYEYRIILEDGTIKYLYEECDVIYDKEGKPEMLFGVIHDITERKHAEEELRENEAKLRTVMNASADYIMMLDREHKIKFINRTELGIDSNTIIGTPLFKLVDKENQSRVKKHLDEVVKKAKRQEYETVYHRPEGTDIHYSSAAVPLLSDGKVIGTIVNSRDITERKQSEEVLKEQKSLLDNILSASSVGLSHAIDRKIMWANDAMEDLFGIPKEKYQGQDTRILYPSDEEYRRVGKIIYSQVQKNKTAQLDAEFTRGDGSVFYGHVKVNYLDLNNPQKGIIVSIIDITERKQAEEALKVSEQTLSTLMSNLPGIAYRCKNDENWTMEFISDGCLDLTGYNTSDILNNNKISFGDLVHPDDQEKVWKDVQDSIRRNKSFQMAYRILTAKGDTKWVWEQGCISPASTKDSIKLEGFITDITTQKLSEVALLESEERIRNILDGIPDMVLHVDTDLKILWANKASLDENPNAIGKPCYISYPGRDKVCNNCPCYRAIETGKIEKGTVHFPATKPSEESYWENIGVPLKDSEGKVVSVIEISRNVTKSKLAEKVERENQMLIQSVVDTSPSCIFIKDFKGKYVFVNNYIAELYGVTPEDMIGKTDLDFAKKLKLTKDEAASFLRVDREVIKTKKKKFIKEEPFTLPDGSKKWFQTTKVPLKLKGNLNYMLGIAEDITEHKRTEESLRTSEAQLSKAMEIAKLGYWEYDVASNLFIFNDYFYDIFCTTADKVGGYTMSPERYSELFLHPDDRSVVEIEMKKALETTDPNFSRQLDHRVIYADGEVGYISVRYFVVKDEQGRTIKTYGANQDITERVKVEQELRKTTGSLQKIIKSSPSGIMSVNAKGNITSWSPACDEIFGWTEKEVFGKFNPTVPKNMFDLYLENIREKQLNMEIKTLTKDGSLIDLSLSSTPLYDEKGNFSGSLGVMTDITEKKKADEEKQRLLNEVQERVKELQCLYELNLLANNENITNDEILQSTTKLIPPTWKYPDITCCRITHNSKTYKTKNFRRTKWCLSSDIYIDKNKEGTIEICYLRKKPDEFEGPFLKEERRLINSISQRISEIIKRKRVNKALKQAEEDYRSIFENAVEGIYQSTPDGKFINVNPALARMLGYKSPENLIKEVTNIEKQLYVDPDQRKKFEKLIEKRSVVRDFEIQLNHKSGKKIWASLASRAVRNEKGKIQYYEGTFEDITKRKKSEEEIRKLSRAVEQSPASIIITDTKGIIEYVNPKFSEITGYKSEEVIGKNPRILKSGETPKEEYKRLWDTISSGGEWSGEFHNKKKNGELYWEYVTITPVLNEEGKVSHYLGVKEDITEAKLAEERLRSSEELNRVINERSPLGISVRSRTGQLLGYNKSWKDIWVKPQTIINDEKKRKRKNLTFTDMDEYLGEWKVEVKKIYEKGGTLYIPELKTNIRRKNAAKWVSQYFYAIKDEDGKVNRVVILTEDVTERKIAEKRLKESEERFRSVFENIPTGIYRTTPDGRILMANPALKKMLGHTSSDELNAMNLEKHEYDKEFSRERFKKMVEEDGVIIGYETKWKKTNGTWVDVKENAKVVRDEDGNIKYYEGTVEDITKRLLAEIELRNSREQLMNLSAHLQTVREEERASMAREIHDDLGQSLTALKMDITWLDKNLYKDRDESFKKIQVMKGLTDSTISSVQKIASELRPAILDDLGVSTAIQWQAEEFSQRSGIKCKVKLKPKDIKLDEKLSIAIYRIFQESLTNVARHARASKVDISLKTVNSSLELIIKDNGIGIDASKIKDPKSIGLIGMQERVYPFKGIVDIYGEKDKGTTIKVNISFKNKKNKS